MSSAEAVTPLSDTGVTEGAIFDDGADGCRPRTCERSVVLSGSAEHPSDVVLARVAGLTGTCGTCGQVVGGRRAVDMPGAVLAGLEQDPLPNVMCELNDPKQPQPTMSFGSRRSVLDVSLSALSSRGRTQTRRRRLLGSAGTSAAVPSCGPA